MIKTITLGGNVMVVTAVTHTTYGVPLTIGVTGF